MKEEKNNKCFICGNDFIQNGCAPGYGLDKHEHKLCYECIGKLDERWLLRMNIGERTDLYITEERKDFQGDKGRIVQYFVQNWPGTFKHRAVYMSRGNHNIAGIQNHYLFVIRDERRRVHKFHGVQFGYNTEILHIRKVKSN